MANKNFVEVFVRPTNSPTTLLHNGTGSGNLGVFACSKFPSNARPVKGQMYDIQARDEDDPFAIEWTAKCTFSGETSEFKTNV